MDNAIMRNLIFTRSFFLIPITTLLLLLLSRPGFAQTLDEYGIGLPENLGPNVNTEWAEIMPVVSPDGQYLYFSRKNAPENTAGQDDLEDIYYSKRQADGSWGEAVHAGTTLNSPSSDILFSFTGDGKAALVYYGKKVNGKEVGLAIARQRNGQWEEPRKITIEGVEDLGDYYYAMLSKDGKHLFLSYAMIGDPLNLDLFYSSAASDDMLNWSEPVFLSDINTPFTEGSPFLSPDGQTLFLISDRPGGNGLADVYVSRRTGDSWTRWTFPESLSGHASTPMYESSVSISSDGKELYISRIGMETSAYGRLDIYRNQFPDSLHLQYSFPLQGRVVDAKTGKSVRASIIAHPQREDDTVAVLATGNDGRFSLNLMPGMLITVRATAPGYKSGGITFDGRRYDPSMEASTVTISLEPGNDNETQPPLATIPTVLFATGSSSLSGGSKNALRRVISQLKQAEAITLTGYTDSVGTAENNLRLSAERAEAVKAFLIQSGISAAKISVRSYGETDPAGNNGTTRGRAANRRVEISVSESGGIGENEPAERVPRPSSR